MSDQHVTTVWLNIRALESALSTQLKQCAFPTLGPTLNFIGWLVGGLVGWWVGGLVGWLGTLVGVQGFPEGVGVVKNPPTHLRNTG